MKVSLDMASFNVVEDNLDILKGWVKNYVDIVFANEEEAKAFTGFEPEKAIDVLSEYCDIVIVKTGKTGSLIKNSDETIKASSIGTTCIDTTGAGDLYASGFLYGLSCNYNLETCGKIASLVAGNVITVYGARMDGEHWKIVNQKVSDLV